MQVMQTKYAYFDGDNIGDSIGNLLHDGREQEAKNLSGSIKLAILKIEAFINSSGNAEIVFTGGDDVLLKFDPYKHDPLFLEEVSRIFTQNTGLSMSCGIGDDANQARRSLITIKQQNKRSMRALNTELDIQKSSMEPKILYIFATSINPDPYINVLAHCSAYCKNIQQVNLVGIVEDRGKEKSKEDDLETIKNDISSQLRSLSDGKYLNLKNKDEKDEDKRWEQIDIPSEFIKPSDCERYKSLQKFSIETKVIFYDDLDENISQLLQSDASTKHLFDLTGVSKDHLIDIYTILSSKRRKSVFSLKLEIEPDFSDKYKNLIHRLKYGSTYKWICLAKTDFTKDTTVKGNNSVDEDMNRLQANLEVLHNYSDDLEKIVATGFARFWSLLYFLILILFFVWSIQAILKPDGWDQIEPLIFIVTTALFIMNYLLQSVFNEKKVSLDPLQLPLALRKWKEKSLRKSKLRRLD